MAQAMVTSSLMHASILSSGKSYVDEEAEAEFLHQCLHFAARYEVGHKPPAPKRTFEQHWTTRCEADWRWAFRMFSAGALELSPVAQPALLPLRRTPLHRRSSMSSPAPSASLCTSNGVACAGARAVSPPQ